MKTTLAPFALMFALVFLPSVCQADYALMYGTGLETCDKLTTAFTEQEYDVSVRVNGVKYPSKSKEYLTWIYGYITAFNFYNKQGKNLVTSNEALVPWMKKHCRDNPEASVMGVTLDFIHEKTGYDMLKDL